MSERVLLGDEAIGLGAVHAGLSAAYSYPGTPATEILEFLLVYAKKHGRPHVAWTTNEKTAFEQALGTCCAGRRALVSMKHVGLNVAADPFMNSALVNMHGGLIVAVADDPGMHSSQNEQDSRFYADFARVICLEPANQQEAYDMARTGLDLSERFGVPALMRLVTRLAHSRTAVKLSEPRPENPVKKAPVRGQWILLPNNARRYFRSLIERQKELVAWSESCPWNTLALNGERRELGVITAGIARNYYLEHLEELGWQPSHLHVGAYPLPVDRIRRLAAHVKRVLVLEDGYPLIERQLRGLLPQSLEVAGRMSGEVPPDGELNPDLVRAALGLPARPGLSLAGLTLPNRPPQLCSGCPHGHMFKALNKALEPYAESVVTSDIGCYTLGALPPYNAVETCVCMGASVGMAKGAAEAGLHPVVATIGDSTFLHSGTTNLMDAAAANTNMTLLILDNQAVAMTGGQPTIVPSSRLREVVLGLGVDPKHLHVLEAMPRNVDANTEVLRREIEYQGLSVVIAVRECLETAKRKKRVAAAAAV
ncbi:MAG TPA: thiamine pyrophosphate-dependent enzyme [Candidatus Saccharimonadales bacterium]|nr:thiamine pyrophosphate-dependent enzyme [Candidatus Saccharimonadales bacterium]